MSDDGAHGLTIIAFIGSVFSPYYAWARRRAGAGGVDPLAHCAVNVSFYSPRGKRWCMTERGRAQVRRDATNLRIGPSALHWDGEALTVRIDEVTAPWPARLEGVVTLRPGTLCSTGHALDSRGRHRWQPIAPAARVEVAMRRPAGLAWRGSGYLDHNSGDEPLETAFARWDWSRAHLGDGRTLVLYDVEERTGAARDLALHIDATGRTEPVAAPPPTALPRTAWRLQRFTRGDARLLRTLEDGPFYARSLLAMDWRGETVQGLHESLSLARFDRAVTRCMLPFRMPRRAGE